MIPTVVAALALTPMSTITHHPFGKTTDGRAVEAYTLVNDKGSSAKILDYGGTVTELYVPDKNGVRSNVVLGFDNISDYEKNSPYFGCLVGRVANRIAKGKFKLNGKEYKLAINNGENALHGGLKGYDKLVWKAKAIQTKAGPSLELTLHDADGTEGYPGTVDVKVIYTLTNDDVLRIEYAAKVSGKSTPINLTNHSYFNLKDAGQTDVYGHVLTLDADKFTPVDDTLIPTGELQDVAGTPIDFTKPKAIGADLLKMGGDPPGYDHNLVVRGAAGTLRRAAAVLEPVSGRTMECWTTEPGIQFYSGNFLEGKGVGWGGAVYSRHHGFCLETQHYPDSINQPKFPSVVVEPGKTYTSTTEYRFGVQSSK